MKIIARGRSKEGKGHLTSLISDIVYLGIVKTVV
jgi:hypothetical protein